MLEKVDMETSKIQLNDNDLIVMVTDGISDCFNSDVSKNQLKTLLKNSRNKDPYTISELVLSLAKKLSNDIAKDDMTVLTAKIRKKI